MLSLNDQAIREGGSPGEVSELRHKVRRGSHEAQQEIAITWMGDGRVGGEGTKRCVSDGGSGVPEEHMH